MPFSTELITKKGSTQERMKIFRESHWKVTLATAGPQSQNLDKTVEAPSQDIAIRRAIQSFPGMQFVSTTAIALDPQVPPPGQKPINPQTQMPKQMAGLRPIQGLRMPGQQQQAEALDPKRFTYPYGVTLPVQLSRVLRETSPVGVTEKHGQYEIVLINETQMRGFVERLMKHRNRDVARIIINGIRSSIE